MKKKINVLYTSCFASLKGGGQKSLLLILKKLDREHVNPFLIVPGKDDLSEEAKKLGVRVFIVPPEPFTRLNIFAALRVFKKVKEIIRANNIDLIHTESPRWLFYVGIIGKALKIKVVFDCRVSDVNFVIDRACYILADIIIAVSKSAASRFAFASRYNKVRLINNITDLDFLPAGWFHKNDEILRIGYFGRIHRRKGIDVLLKAVKRLDVKIEVIIMGDGDGQYLSELNQLAAGLNVKFKKYQIDISHELKEIDAAVLPCVEGEGLSRMLMESMAMGKLVIASDFPANRETLGEGLKDFIFPAKDDKALADIIKKISLNKEGILKPAGIYARKRAETLFDVKKNIKEIEKVYDYLLT